MLQRAEVQAADLAWARGDVRVNWTFTRLRLPRRRHALDPGGDGARAEDERAPRRVHTTTIVKPHAGGAVPEDGEAAATLALRTHIPPHEGLVVLVEPFFALSSAITPQATCCHPAAHILDAVAAIRATLPARYACLHARVEEDMYNYCCSLLESPAAGNSSRVSADTEIERKRGLTRHRPAFAAWAEAGGRGDAPACSATQPPPPRECYTPAARIAQVMHADARMPLRSVVYGSHMEDIHRKNTAGKEQL